MTTSGQNYFRSPARRRSLTVNVGNVVIGGGAPVVIQSMTDTDTADINSTVAQIAALYNAGSQLVRITIDRVKSAAAVPYIREHLDKLGLDVPLIGDFHYIGHKLLTDYPACAQALAKYRINPGNVGFHRKRERQFLEIVSIAIQHKKPIRIGVNWGSLDQELLMQLMDCNTRKKHPPLNSQEVVCEAVVQSAINSAKLAEKAGLSQNQIILSAKVSRVQDLITVYTMLANRCPYALHIGLTEAGMGLKGIVSSSVAMGILLQMGIGDTIRVSLTPEPGGDRCREVQVAQELLQVMEFQQFTPSVTACPGCGRTTSSFFQKLAQKVQEDIKNSMPLWRKRYLGVETLQIAVMGCIVNGPGESKNANIGISLPGIGENLAAPVFIDGKKAVTLRGETIATDFKKIIEEYIEQKFGPSSS